ncbi:LysR substrate-binding domain-containing protein, partial [Burkholderia pseudomallei]
LADGRLRIVLGAYPPPPMPVSVLYPHRRQLSSRVRAFAQWLRERVDAAQAGAGDGACGAPGSSGSAARAPSPARSEPAKSLLSRRPRR